MRVLAVVMIVLLAGCGASDDKSSTSVNDPLPAAATTSPAPTAKPTPAAPTGKPAPQALSRFRCLKNAKGVWNASGYLANNTKKQVTYQVTVYVGEVGGGAEKARTKQVPNVRAGGSTPFVIRKIPAPKSGGPCYIQVLAQD